MIKMNPIKMKFMFDWGSGVCLWSTNEEAVNRFGDYPVLPAQLPVSESLISKLEKMIEDHDNALNWADPSGELQWDRSQIDSFLKSAKDLYQQLCTELGAGYEIEFIESM